MSNNSNITHNHNLYVYSDEPIKNLKMKAGSSGSLQYRVKSQEDLVSVLKSLQGGSFALTGEITIKTIHEA